MIDFEPTEDESLIRSQIDTFAESLRESMRQAEADRELGAAMLEQALAMGVGSAGLPEEVGGAGLGMRADVIIEESLAYGDPAAGFACAGPGALGLLAAELAPERSADIMGKLAESDGQVRFGAVAWSEPQIAPEGRTFSAIARPDGDGWVLNGEKAFVANATRAERFVVFCNVEGEGPAAFVVEGNAKGLERTPRVTTLGLDMADVAGIKLAEVRVPKDARIESKHGFDIALVRFFAKHGLRVAARAIGLCRAAFDVTLDYAQMRKAFGKPIAHFQAVAFTLADRASDVESVRAAVWRAAAAWDLGEDEREAIRLSAYAISAAKQAAMQAGGDAVQLHGGAGFMRDYPVEKWMRDAKQIMLWGLTIAQADRLAALAAIGAELKVRDALPGADCQWVIV